MTIKKQNKQGNRKGKKAEIPVREEEKQALENDLAPEIISKLKAVKEEGDENTYDLSEYKVLVEFLGKFLGPDYEILLHDVSKLPNSVVAIANPLSGREVGSPITELGLRIIQEKMYQSRDYYVNYQGRRGNDHYRSSSFFIKDDQGELVALLCINFTDARFLEEFDRLQKIIHPKDWVNPAASDRVSRGQTFDQVNQEGGIEEFHSNIDELMVNIFEDVIEGNPIPIGYMKQEDRLEVTRKLDARGMFRMKGAVNFVADKLDCSVATVYRYLNMINWQE